MNAVQIDSAMYYRHLAKLEKEEIERNREAMRKAREEMEKRWKEMKD